MLRAEIRDSKNTRALTLEGRFTGDNAEYIRTLVTRFNSKKELIVDLRGVTFVDSVGEQVLSFFGRLGGEFIADDSYCLDVCERLDLPLTRYLHAGTFGTLALDPLYATPSMSS